VELRDTWVYDTRGWALRAPPHAPPPRTFAPLVYDAAHHRVVLFGGFAHGAYLGDTWAWDGTDWSELVATAASPAPRSMHAMAYEEARGVVVLAGGTDGNMDFPDVWELDGAIWTLRNASTLAPVDAQMAFDPTLGQVIVVGGYGGRQTWAWDGAIG